MFSLLYPLTELCGKQAALRSRLDTISLSECVLPRVLVITAAIGGQTQDRRRERVLVPRNAASVSMAKEFCTTFPLRRQTGFPPRLEVAVEVNNPVVAEDLQRLGGERGTASGRTTSERGQTVG
jgi:hypothetical protein